MTYVVKPKFHHPELPKNKLGYTHRDYEGKVSTLCAGCGHNRSPPPSSKPASSSRSSRTSRQDFRHRLVVEDAGLFPRQFARFQFGAGRMPSVLTGANLANRDLNFSASRGRRFRLDRLRPVRPLDAPRREYDLDRREQRRVRADQGRVFRHRRPWLEIEARRRQLRQRHRHRRHRAPTRRQLRGALIFRRQDTAHSADRGGDRKSRRLIHRRDLAVRRFQQSRRLDQELRLCARAQRSGERLDVITGPRADPRRLCAGHGAEGRAARRHRVGVRKVAADYDVQTGRRRWDSCKTTSPKARS